MVRATSSGSGFLVIPVLLLVIIIALIIGATAWPWSARVLRAQTLSLRRRDYVEAARATGESTWRIIGFELLPNLTAVIASRFVDTVVFAVLAEIALAFIGVSGVSFVPAGLAIAVLGTGLALLNVGIDEFVNPRLRGVPRSKRVRMRVGFTPVLPEEAS
jgi:peptide/nickel transport system permease protein